MQPPTRSTYRITDPNGRVLRVQLERDPTEDEVKAIFERYDQTQPRPPAPAELTEGTEVPSNIPGRPVAFGGPMRSMLQGAYATPEQQAQRKAELIDALPAVAATAATMAPPVAAAAGLGGLALRAGVAGAAGMATAGATGSELWDAFTEGAKQAAAQIGGEAIGSALVKGGQRIYSGILKAGKSLKKEFPTVAEDLYSQGRGINADALEAVNDSIDALRTQVDNTIVQGARGGAAPIDATDLMMAYQEMMDYADQMIANKSQGPAIKQAIEKEFQYLKKQLGAGIDVVDAQARKRYFQNQADTAYAAVRRGNKSQLGWRDLMNMAVAREFQHAIERRLPEVAGLNRQIQSNIGQARALSDALGRIDNHMPFGSVSDVVAIGSGVAANSASAAAFAKLLSYPKTGQFAATQAGKLGRNVNLPLALRVGQIVTVGDRKMRIVKVSPDGTYEGVVVQ